MEILVNSRGDNKEALNIIIDSGTTLDRRFPGTGGGSVADLAVSMTLLGYNTDENTTLASVNDKLVFGAIGGGASSRDVIKNSSESSSQGESAVLFSMAGFCKNNATFWSAVKPVLKLEAFPDASLIKMFKITKTRIHRVFFVHDINDIETYSELFLPLFATIN